MAGGDEAGGGDFFAATGFGPRAARVEGASGRRMDGRGDIARDDGSRGAAWGVGSRDGSEEGLGVGVLGCAADLAGRAQLGHSAEVHHQEAMADVLDHGEIMRDEKVGQTMRPL